MEVIVMESATLALAIYAITFEANPLGEQPIKMMPAAISSGKLKIEAIVKPKIGIIAN